MSLLSRLIARTGPNNGETTAMSQHTVSSFDADLKALAGMVGEMGDRAGRAVADATRALIERNAQLAQQVIASDRSIDLLQHDIEERAVAILARRQPMAIDLRETISTMRIANDLERVGDLAKNVAKRVIAIGDQASPVNVTSGLSTLSDRVGEQLRQVLIAYRTRDDRASLAVWKADGAIDGLFTSLFRELLTYMMEDPRSAAAGLENRSHPHRSRGRLQPQRGLIAAHLPAIELSSGCQRRLTIWPRAVHFRRIGTSWPGSILVSASRLPNPAGS